MIQPTSEEHDSYVLSGWLLRLIPVALTLAVVGSLAQAWHMWNTTSTPDGTLGFITLAATLMLALTAVLTLKQNSALVAAATQEARASTDGAKAARETVQEMQRQRELSFRPWLVIDRRDRVAMPGAPPVADWVVTNIGTGPAVNVKICVRKWFSKDQMEWMSIDLGGIEPSGSRSFLEAFAVPATMHQRAHDRLRCLIDDIERVRYLAMAAVRYEDWFGTVSRVTFARVDADVHPEEWRPSSSEERPSWMACD